MAERDSVDADPIVIVDGDAAIGPALCALLDLDSLRVHQATLSSDALELIARVRPSLVFLDLDLPRIGGAAIVCELRARRIWVPIVLMSADPDLDWWAAELQVPAFLRKPFGPSNALTAMALLFAA